jgi:GGDEF domain-containing protein
MELSPAITNGSARKNVRPSARRDPNFYTWCAFALFATLFLEMMGTIAFVHLLLPHGLDHPFTHMVLNVASGIFAVVTLLGICVSEYRRRNERAQTELLRKLERESATGSRIIDQDTNTFTREYFNQVLLREIGRASVSAKSFCLLQCVVETSGLSPQNQALSSHLETTLAQILRKNLRASDVIARTDQGEFTVILPELDEYMAQVPVDRINLAVERWNRNSTAQYTMRIKFGLYECDPGSKPEELLLRVSQRCQLDQYFSSEARRASAHAGLLSRTSPEKPRHVC